jgi:NACHT domain
MGSRLFVLVLLLAGPCAGQSRPPASRDQLVRAIERYADEDVAAGNPLSEDRVEKIFADNRFGLTPYDISQIYRTRYFAARPWWKKIPSWVWIGLAALGLFFRPLKAFAEERLKKTYEDLYVQYASARPFRGRALERYRAAVVRNYEKLKIPFRDAPLDMRQIYVPLKFTEAAGTSPVDAAEAILANRKLMVRGNPGSGKSMLLKSILLSWADGRLTGIPEDPIPVLVELGRLNNAATTVEQQIAASFDVLGFPKAEPFVERALENKGLLLLLDGLDEVNARERARVVTAIRDLLKKTDCRAIITCRTQVYKDEFAATADKTLEVAEFKDQDIVRLLRAWEKSMQPDQSVEQLMQTLRERPRILAMARNPLLLTMVAYLYSDRNVALPHSRAEFYREATQQLLDKWQVDFNKFTWAAKAAVLGQIALRLQEKAKEDEDRRSLSLQEILEKIRQVLPAVDIKVDDAGAVLDEIVERSGLLLRIDGGARFQFAHLTMQEYCAATALSDDRVQLLKNFGKDRDTWREVLTLWCGLPHDSTAMIAELAELEPVTALECVADARIVKAEVADRNVESMKARLRDALPDEPLPNAFGLLAASPGPRGEATFAWLSGELRSDDARYRRVIAGALACSNLAKAASRLAEDSSAEALAALEDMGDVAVRALADRGAAEALVRMGTAKALEAAVGLLWHGDEDAQRRAAFALAPKIKLDTFDFRGTLLPDHATARIPFEWVWQPFEEPAGSALPTIAARIVELCASAAAHAPLESVLAIPVYIASGRPEFLEAALQEEIAARERRGRRATREDWAGILRPTEYMFESSWLCRSVFVLVATLWVAGVVSACLYLHRGWFWGAIAVQAVAGAMLVLAGRDQDANTNPLQVGTFLVGVSPYFLSSLLEPANRWLGLVAAPLTPVLIYLDSLLLSRLLVPLAGVVAFWVVLYGAGLGTYALGYRKERLAKNPLKGLLAIGPAGPGGTGLVTPILSRFVRAAASGLGSSVE